MTVTGKDGGGAASYIEEDTLIGDTSYGHGYTSIYFSLKTKLEKLKHIVYGISYRVEKEQRASPAIDFLGFTIFLLQFISWGMHPRFGFAHQGPISKGVYDTFSFFTLAPFIARQGESVALVAVRVVYSICLAMLGVYLYGMRLAYKEEYFFKWPFRVINTYVRALNCGLAVPIAYVLSIGFCTDNHSAGVCAGISAQPYDHALSAVSLLFVIPTSLSSLLLIFERNPSSQAWLARVRNKQVTAMYVVQYSLVIFFASIESAGETSWKERYSVLLLLFACISFTYHAIVYPVFFHKWVNQYTAGMIGAATASAAMATTLVWNDDSSGETRDWLAAVLLVSCLLAYALSFALSFLFCHFFYSWTGPRVSMRLSSAIAWVQKNINENLADYANIPITYPRGTSSSSSRNATGIPCWFHSPDHVEMSIRFILDDDAEQSQQMMTAIFEEGRLKFPNCATVRYHQALYSMHALKDVEKGSHYMRDVMMSISQSNISLDFDIGYFIHVTNKYVASLSQSENDASEQYTRMMKKLHHAQSLHAECLKKLKHFWRLLMVSTIDLIQVDQVMREAMTIQSRANYAFECLMEQYGKQAPVLRAYANFLSLVQNMPSSASSLLQRADALEDENMSEKVQAEKQARIQEQNASEKKRILAIGHMEVSPNGIILGCDDEAIILWGAPSTVSLVGNPIGILFPFLPEEPSRDDSEHSAVERKFYLAADPTSSFPQVVIMNQFDMSHVIPVSVSVQKLGDRFRFTVERLYRDTKQRALLFLASSAGRVVGMSAAFASATHMKPSNILDRPVDDLVMVVPSTYKEAKSEVHFSQWNYRDIQINNKDGAPLSGKGTTFSLWKLSHSPEDPDRNDRVDVRRFPFMIEITIEERKSEKRPIQGTVRGSTRTSNRMSKRISKRVSGASVGRISRRMSTPLHQLPVILDNPKSLQFDSSVVFRKKGTSRGFKEKVKRLNEKYVVPSTDYDVNIEEVEETKVTENSQGQFGDDTAFASVVEMDSKTKGAPGSDHNHDEYDEADMPFFRPQRDSLGGPIQYEEDEEDDVDDYHDDVLRDRGTLTSEDIEMVELHDNISESEVDSDSDRDSQNENDEMQRLQKEKDSEFQARYAKARELVVARSSSSEMKRLAYIIIGFVLFTVLVNSITFIFISHISGALEHDVDRMIDSGQMLDLVELVDVLRSIMDMGIRYRNPANNPPVYNGFGDERDDAYPPHWFKPWPVGYIGMFYFASAAREVLVWMGDGQIALHRTLLIDEPLLPSTEMKFRRTTFPISKINEMTGEVTEFEENVYDIGSRFHKAAVSLAAINYTAWELSDATSSVEPKIRHRSLAGNSDFFFLQQNTFNGVKHAYAFVVDEFSSLNQARLNEGKIVINLLLFFTVISCITLVWFALRNAVALVNNSKLLSLTSFLSIPRGVIKSLSSFYTVPDDPFLSSKEGGSVRKLNLSSISMKLDRKQVRWEGSKVYSRFHLQYSVATLLLAAIFVVNVVLIVNSLDDIKESRHELYMSHLRRGYFREEFGLVEDLLSFSFRNDTAARIRLDEHVTELKRINDALSFGDDDLGLKGITDSSSDLGRLVFGNACSFPQVACPATWPPDQIEVTSRGMQYAMMQYVENMRRIIEGVQGELAFFSPDFVTVLHHHQFAMASMINLSQILYKEKIEAKLDDLRDMQAIFFAVMVVLIFAECLFVYYPMLSFLKNQAKNSQNMFLLIPVQVVKKFPDIMDRMVFKEQTAATSVLARRFEVDDENGEDSELEREYLIAVRPPTVGEEREEDESYLANGDVVYDDVPKTVRSESLFLVVTVFISFVFFFLVGMVWKPKGISLSDAIDDHSYAFFPVVFENLVSSFGGVGTGIFSWPFFVHEGQSIAEAKMIGLYSAGFPCVITLAAAAFLRLPLVRSAKAFILGSCFSASLSSLFIYNHMSSTMTYMEASLWIGVSLGILITYLLLHSSGSKVNNESKRTNEWVDVFELFVCGLLGGVIHALTYNGADLMCFLFVQIYYHRSQIESFSATIVTRAAVNLVLITVEVLAIPSATITHNVYAVFTITSIITGPLTAFAIFSMVRHLRNRSSQSEEESTVSGGEQRIVSSVGLRSTSEQKKQGSTTSLSGDLPPIFSLVNILIMTAAYAASAFLVYTIDQETFTNEGLLSASTVFCSCCISVMIGVGGDFRSLQHSSSTTNAGLEHVHFL